MPRFKHGTNRDAFGAAMRRSAESRRCPKCGRGSALVRIPGNEVYAAVTYCRWLSCDYRRDSAA